MEHQYISGIQQIGIGVEDTQIAKNWYRDNLGMSALIFDDEAEAALMTPYTGGEIHKRRALLTVNMAGGGGFEIWQFTSRKPQKANLAFEFGDLGINMPKLKTGNITDAHLKMKEHNVPFVSDLYQNSIGEDYFFIQDIFGNYFQITEPEDNSWFNEKNNIIGGVMGAIIGVSDMDKALPLFTEVLGISNILLDSIDTIPDCFSKGREIKMRSVILHKPDNKVGAFSKLLGEVEIELVQVLDVPRKKIFENRYWGDIGYIHLCFDVVDMPGLKSKAESFGYQFTVDSGESFGMGAAAGRFAYIEEPTSGALIELVETHKVPIMKKLGLFYNVSGRGQKGPLPNWMVNLLALSKT